MTKRLRVPIDRHANGQLTGCRGKIVLVVAALPPMLLGRADGDCVCDFCRGALVRCWPELT
jgi:hypothetical protein